jgi:hypothetical protein
MPPHNCELCNYNTNLLGNFKQHLKTNKHRAKLNNGENNYNNLDANIPKHPKTSNKHPKNIQKHPITSNKHPLNIQKKYNCEHCNFEFTLYANMRRHTLHRCKDNPEFINKIIQSKNNQIKKMENEKKEWTNEKKELYKKIDELISKVGNNNTNNNIQTQNNNNIIINNYGNEDIDHLTDKIKDALIKIPYGAIPKLIESVHFNDEIPKNKNIIFPNKNENLLKIYHGGKWVYKNKNEMITDLIDSKYMIMDSHYDDTKNSISNKVQKSYEKFQKYYDEGDENVTKQLKTQCGLILLNHREIQ